MTVPSYILQNNMSQAYLGTLLSLTCVWNSDIRHWGHSPLLMSAGIRDHPTSFLSTDICFWSRSRLGFAQTWGVGSAILTLPRALRPFDSFTVCVWLKLLQPLLTPLLCHALPNLCNSVFEDLNRSGLMSPLIWKSHLGATLCSAAGGARETAGTKYSVRGAETASFISSFNYLSDSSIRAGLLGPGSSVSVNLSGR